MRWPAQEGGDFDVRYLTAGRRISLMPHNGQAGRGVAGKEPGIAVRAAVELLHPVLIGPRTQRAVLYPVRRDDAISGLAQSGDDAGSEGIRVAACCFTDRVGDDPLDGWNIGSRHLSLSSLPWCQHQ